MKILIIMPWVKQGGAELIAARTAFELEKLGHKVRLVALFADTSLMGDYSKQIDYMTLGRLGGVLAKNNLLLYFVGTPLLFVQIILQLFWADILFPHSLPSYWLASVIGLFTRKKIVWLCNEPPKKRKLKNVGLVDWIMWRVADSWIDKLLVKRINKIIVYSQAIQKEVKYRYNKNAKLTRLGVDYKFFNQRNSKIEQGLIEDYRLQGKFILLMVGKLHPQKNQRLGLSVLTRVLKNIPNAVLILVGEGPDKQKLKVMSYKLKVKDKVVFTGFRKPEEVRAWYGISSLVLFPSVKQTAMVGQSWGFIPFEALCQKKLSIVSDSSGAAEVIKEQKIGFVCPPTVCSFSQQIINYYQKRSYYQRWAQKGKNWVKNHLTWRCFGKEVNKFFTA